MTIPDFQTIMRPLLVALQDGQERTSTEIRAALATLFSLTEEELAEMIPSGRAKTFANRVAWAMTHMYQAGLLERPRRSVYRIAPRGTEVLAAQPDRVDLKILAQFQEYQVFRTRGGHSHPTTITDSELELVSSDQTPEEQIGAAYRSIRSALVADLLERVGDKPPRFFERLVLDVLRAMGYGGVGEDATSHLGQSGDEGVDGVIREDELGLDLIYVQAKRWANPVGRPPRAGERLTKRPSGRGPRLDAVKATIAAQGGSILNRRYGVNSQPALTRRPGGGNAANCGRWRGLNRHHQDVVVSPTPTPTRPSPRSVSLHGPLVTIQRVAQQRLTGRVRRR